MAENFPLVGSSLDGERVNLTSINEGSEDMGLGRYDQDASHYFKKLLLTRI